MEIKLDIHVLPLDNQSLSIDPIANLISTSFIDSLAA
jgi:hypothetical protein